MAPSPWPETDDEREEFLEWQHDVGEGNTNLGFRDWLTAKIDDPIELLQANQGWTDTTLGNMALDYIGSMNLRDDFVAFLGKCADFENSGQR